MNNTHAKYIRKNASGPGFDHVWNDPETIAKRKAHRHMPLEQRFWSQVEKTKTCWLWTGSILATGYGQLSVGGKMRKAHHVVLELRGLEPRQAGMVVDHVCRVRACVNPDHLRIVTEQVNGTENNISPLAAFARRTHCHKCNNPLSGANLAIYTNPGKKTRHGGKMKPRPARYCLTCYPNQWRYAVIPRPRPPGSQWKPTDPDYDQRPRKSIAREG